VALAGFFFDQDFELQVFQIADARRQSKESGHASVSGNRVRRVQLRATSYPRRWSGSRPLTGAATRSSSSPSICRITALVLENIPTRAVTPDQAGILPKYLIVVRLAGKQLGGTGHYRWLTDTLTSHAVGERRHLRSRDVGEGLGRSSVGGNV
jgi:hypothetical protein